jgi:hypothetical protein
MDGWMGRANGESMARAWLEARIECRASTHAHVHAHAHAHVHVHVHLAVQVLDAADDICEVAPRVALLKLAAPDHAPEELTYGAV